MFDLGSYNREKLFGATVGKRSGRSLESYNPENRKMIYIMDQRYLELTSSVRY